MNLVVKFKWDFYREVIGKNENEGTNGKLIFYHVISYSVNDAFSECYILWVFLFLAVCW